MPNPTSLKEAAQMLPDLESSLKRQVNTMKGLTDAERADRLRKAAEALARLHRILDPYKDA